MTSFDEFLVLFVLFAGVAVFGFLIVASIIYLATELHDHLCARRSSREEFRYLVEETNALLKKNGAERA